MISHYAWRLVCLSLASFVLVNATAGLAATLASRTAIRMAERMRPRSAARFLFALRALPFALGTATVLIFCVPSYLWLEPQASSERIGWVCLTLAALGIAGWAGSIARVARAVSASVRISRAWLRSDCKTLLPGESSKAVIIENDAPLLALVGVFRPGLVISSGVLRSLSSEELHLALQHENAHRTSRDNFKRLLLLLMPAPLPFFRGLASLQHSWAKLSEWAADDEAVRGDSRRALSLATALLRVARMGASPRLSFLHTSLCAGDHDLSARVERLLRVDTLPAVTRFPLRALAIGSSLGMAVCLVLVVAWPSTLSSVHRLLELFLH